MRENRTYGSVRGALSNERPYRDRFARNDGPLGKHPHSRGTKCPGDSSLVSLDEMRVRGMPGDGHTHGPPATRRAGGSHHRY
jgi:hypothetical protein